MLKRTIHAGILNTGTLNAELKEYLSQTKIKKLFTLGTELFDAGKSFIDKPTVWTGAQALFAVGKVLVNDIEVWADDYFGTEAWVEPFASDFVPTLLKILNPLPYERLKAIEDETYVRTCVLPNGVKAGWLCRGKRQRTDSIFVEAHRRDEAKSCIKQMLWAQYNGKSLVMRRNDVLSFSSEEAKVSFDVDDAFETKMSKRASDMAAQLRTPLAEGITRSIMLYGPPGTGKSTLARTLVEELQLRSFRIRVADLGNLESTTLFDAINLFEPDAVILDDFDRANGQDKLLETLEFFQTKVKLVIVTVNNRHMLDQALLRPGRIDVFQRIERMDPEVVHHVLGKYADGFEHVKEWPIAFINEYVKRRRYMNVEDAAASIEELATRVREMTATRDPDEDDEHGIARMLKILKREAQGDDKESDPFLEGDEDNLEK